MTKTWVSNTGSKPTIIGGKLLQPGEGTFIDSPDPAAPVPVQIQSQLTGAGDLELVVSGTRHRALSTAKAAAVDSMVSGDGHPDYVFYMPGRQQVGVPTDRSGKGRNAIRKAGLSEAASWGTVGWLTSVAGTDGVVAVVDPACAVNWATDVLVVAGRVKMAAPAANATILGIGANPTPHGFYLSARTTGKLLLGVSSVEGFYNTGDIPGVVLDGTEHAWGFYIDGPNKNLGFYIDGGLAFTATGLSPFGTASSMPIGFAVGAGYYQATSQASVASTVREVHMLKHSSMPLNMDDIVLQLAAVSGKLTKIDVKQA